MKYLKKYVVPTLIAAALCSTAGVSAEAKGKEFKDVSKNADYYHTVQKLVNFKIIGGYSDGTFKPGNYVTRGQAASMIARIMGVDLKNVKNPGYQDVSTAYTHYPAIAKLTELGIFDESEKFYPNRQLTRAEMADILVNAFDLESDEIKSYTDVDSDDAYYKEIGIIGDLNITRNEGKFRPEDGVKRANFAVFIERAINFKRADNKYDYWDTWGTWDSKGVIKPPKKDDDDKDDKDDDKPGKGPKPSDDDVKIEKIEALEEKIEDAMDDLEDAQEDIEDILEDLEEAIEEDDEDDIEDEKEKLSKALKSLDKLIADAKDILKDAQQANYKELQSAEDKLEKEIRDANKVLDNAYAKTFDKEYYEEQLDEALEELEDSIDDAEKSLDNNRFAELKRDYKALKTELVAAAKVFDSYDDSNVDSLEDEAADLEDAIEEAEDLLKDIEKWFENKLDGQVDYFEDLFEEIIDELEEAIDDKDRSDIYDAREKLEKAIENAENLVKDYKDLDIKALEDEKETLDKAIQKATDEWEDSK